MASIRFERIQGEKGSDEGVYSQTLTRDILLFILNEVQPEGVNVSDQNPTNINHLPKSLNAFDHSTVLVLAYDRICNVGTRQILP